MYVAIALVGLFLVWAVAVQVGARRQEVAVVSLSGPEAQAVVQSVLGGKRFQWVEGPGQVNAKPRLKWRAPTISVDVEPRTDAYGSRIEIWLGAFRVQAGLIQQPRHSSKPQPVRQPHLPPGRLPPPGWRLHTRGHPFRMIPARKAGSRVRAGR